MIEFPFERERSSFPILSERSQLTSCSQSALARPVEAAVQRYLTHWREDGMAWVAWMDGVEASRRAFATLIGAEPDEVAVVSSVSHAVAALGTTLDYPSDRPDVVTTEMDFPTVGHSWLPQEQGGARIRFVPWDGGPLRVEALEPHVSRSTRVLSIPHQSYYNGARADLVEVAALAQEHGTLLLVDAYQSLGTCRVDVRALGIDALVAGAQKYLLGMPGIAFLYLRRELAERLSPRVTGWFGQGNPFAFDIHGGDPAPGARRFDAGTPPMVNGAAAAAGLDLLLTVGIDRIETYLRELTGFGLQQARERGLELATPDQPDRVGPNVAVRVGDANAVAERLAGQDIIVSPRRDVVRIAPHFYTRPTELTDALDAVADIVAAGPPQERAPAP
ncbi:aminotransferase class V-fold PLP-dependent enzyme [Egibacter rhizosphaerae]|uniref:Aminotransferase class V-fold PLP-dependent enzyme n=1 Tax=Egibacter rhizosphaerae TaxID=1670831 RepID=A0A411YGN7_9ACTN|nr:aminotransferase class V-fold PLP-dependent enzyme [Egibacter rhizosphaerae]QBI20414.1 aminotransferase class V-fold PLP-dependent enzyme [Egibacter rhizosphaerae]